MKRFFIIGDIHGRLGKLDRIVGSIEGDIHEDDTLIFLGDYIDRGPDSYEVIEKLIDLSHTYNTVFLTGNHEDMFIRFATRGDNYSNYFNNGGGFTVKSYIRNLDDFYIPEKHLDFFSQLKLFYESEDFIAVHAGLNPGIEDINKQGKYDLIWIREEFFTAPGRWEKTVIFGHTPTPYINNSDHVYFDDKRNIIGLDTNAMSDGFPLSCLRWPDRRVYQAY